MVRTCVVRADDAEMIVARGPWSWLVRARAVEHAEALPLPALPIPPQSLPFLFTGGHGRRGLTVQECMQGKKKQ